MTEDEFREFNPRPGDVLHPKPMAITAISTGGSFAYVLGNKTIIFPEHIDHIERAPRVLKVGDRVRHGQNDILAGEMIGLSGLYAWVQWDGEFSPSTYALTDLEPVE